MFLRLTTSDREGVRDVAVEAEPTVTVAELGQSLGLPASALSGADPATEITRAGVFEGATLPRTSSDRLPVGAMRLEFVAGPFSGETVGLPAGSTITVGSGEGMLLRVLDPSLDSHHATLVVTDRVVRGSSDDREHWVTVRPAGTPGTVVVNGERLTEDAQIGTQDLVQLGSSVVRVGRVPVSDADIVADGSGWLAFNRGARIRPPTARPTVTLPGTQPADRDRAPLPWIAMLLPVIMGVTMATLFHSPRFLMFAFMSPLMVAGNFSMNRRRDRRTGERTLENWRQEVADARDAVARLRRLQRLRAWRERLDPVTLADIAIAPTARLWERRLTDPDAVEVRIGVGDADLDVSFEGKRLREDGIDVPIGVSPSPIVVNLAAGPVGIAGPRAITAGLARSMLVQLAVTRSPRDLDIVVLCEDGGEADWSWVRWLPHCNGGVSAFARIGNTNESRAARLRELGALIDRRWGAGDSREPIDSQTVVFIDQARAFRMLPAMITLLERGPAVGVLVVAIDDDRAKLPQECATEVLIDGVDLTLGRVVATTGSCDRFLLDAVTPGFAEQIARALSPVVHAAGAGDESLLPSYSRFVDLLGIDLDDHDWLVRSWTPGRRETRAVVGAGLHAPFALDLALDGPHALVAGTTGAGKSEFLQTLVVSLALVNRPDALNFVFVDYKGGSAFADCERLPHTVGMVTNLDGWGTERALESLDAELKRRESVLRELGAKDADAAWDKDPITAAARGLARLVLVIDEFAELKQELPDFITGLIRIARVGRSLGVHLILATQRPSGSITPEMQSNTNLRVALRVIDKADSVDVLGSGEAAMISPSTPGRGYVRGAAGATPTGFQTARVAGRRPGAVRVAATGPAVVPVSWWQVGEPVQFPKVATNTGPVDHDDTDLRALVNLIDAAARELSIPKNPSPWLEPLPEQIAIDQIGSSSTAEGVIVGMEDIPTAQSQMPLRWDMVRDSHLAVIGGARSGKTTTVRMLLAQLALTYPGRDLHLYVLDCGNGALVPLARIPQCGAVVTALETDRITRLISRIREEIVRRQQVLSVGGFGDIAAQRAAVAAKDRLPYVVVAIDGWDRLFGDQDDAMSFRDRMSKILREAPAVGVRFLITGDRLLLTERAASFIETKYILPLTDADDYAQTGLRKKELPRVIPPGRILMAGNPIREIQVALLPGGADDQDQHRTFVDIVEQVRARERSAAHDADSVTDPMPFRLDVLPTRVTVAEAAELPLAPGFAADGVLVGVGGDTLSRITADLEGNPGFLVAGDRRRGKSSLLAMMLDQVVADGVGAVVVALEPSPLTQAAARWDVPVLAELDPSDEEFVTPFRAARARSNEGGRQRVVTFVDDVGAVSGSVLATALAKNPAVVSLVVAVGIDELHKGGRALVELAQKGKTGILLSPSTTMHGSQAFTISLPRRFLGTAPAGRGVVFVDGSYQWVQVPVVSE